MDLGSRGVSLSDEDSTVTRVSQQLNNKFSEKGVKQALDFQPRSTDVIIVGYSKSGTTWMQQIVHQIRTGGDEDFEDITMVVPMLETAIDLGQDLNAEQSGFPRCFKVQHWLSPKSDGKNIIILRDPHSVTVAYSSYKWYESWEYFKSEELSMEEFVIGYWIQPNCLYQSYLKFIASWWNHHHNPRVMLVFYEDLVENRGEELKRIAKFMGIDQEGNIDVVMERSSFEYMKLNWNKFNSNALKKAWNKAAGLNEEAGMSRSKIRTGSTTEGKEKLPGRTCALIDSKWKEIAEPITGFSSYGELRKGTAPKM